MSVPPEVSSGPEQPSPPTAVVRALDLALRILGGVVAVAAAVVTAALELLLSMVRVGGVPVGVSVLLAVVANVALSRFANHAVGRRWALALPAVAWFALMVVASGGTGEGDVLIAADNWVGLAMIFAGSVAFAVMAFRLIIAPRQT
ncbi:hypothetical protein [Plantactinospora sp. CA-290183]|uniref:hypothetical protein n=1 Tax=Plantactinospora sp. CA-290183 TaxID=3240006 RepID=UPI003D8AEFF0